MNEDERADLIALERVLTLDNGFALIVIAPDGGTVSMPDSSRQLPQDVTQLLIAGEAVTIVAVPPEVAVAQAAEFLDERVKDVQRLIDNGRIPTIEGACPVWVRRVDVIACRDAEAKERRAALQGLVQLGQEMEGNSAS
jgi:hypothetical protein